MVVLFQKSVNKWHVRPITQIIRFPVVLEAFSLNIPGNSGITVITSDQDTAKSKN